MNSSCVIEDDLREKLMKICIIGHLKVGQKLSVKPDLEIYNEGLISWLLRNYRNDGRRDTLRYLDELFKLFERNLEIYINSTGDEKFYNKQQNLLETSLLYMYSAIEGINNLASTYKNCPYTSAGLESIVRNHVLICYESILKKLDPKRVGKQYLQEIMFQGRILKKNTDENI